MTSTTKCYSELIKLPTFEERFEYLRFRDCPAFTRTFGGYRIINQEFYHSEEWKAVRNRIIIRDEANDLGVPDRPIASRIIVHHINPLDMDVFRHHPEVAFDEENLICVSYNTHEAIHYGFEQLLFKGVPERKPNDQCPWK